MRVTSLTIFAAFVIVSSSAPQLARAQVPSVPSSESQQSMYSRVKEKPYSAMQTETRVNTLDDGTKITKKTEALIWRDREGRVRIERTLTSNTGPDIHHVIAYDLVGNAQLSWTSERKVAEISPLLRPGLPQTAAPSLAGPSKTMPSAQQEPAQTGPLRYHREELPPEEIDGLHIVGYRTTHVVPAGTAKNEHDVVVTDEFKYCTDLDIAFSIHMGINPLGANYSVELTNISIVPSRILRSFSRPWDIKQRK